MKNLTDNELLDVTGGSISSSLINATTKMITTIMDVGRSLGTAIRRLFTGNVCPF